MDTASSRTEVDERDALAERLRACAILPTAQRVEIARVLFERPRHLSADQILALVNEQHAATSKATVYNTLKLFLEKRLIRELIVDPTKVFYDPNTEPHHHLYNTETGELSDFSADGVTVQGLPALPEHLVAEGVEIIVRMRPRA